MDLAINALLTHPPGDELSVLRTKIENQYKFVLQNKIAPDFIESKDYNFRVGECEMAGRHFGSKKGNVSVIFSGKS